jgi:membrane fusion protein (multidrug efflux system)
MYGLLLLLACLGCGEGSADGSSGASADERAEKKPRPDPRTLVEVTPVARGSVANHLVASATVESEAQATLVPETQGIVTGIHVEEGDRVAKGQLLAVVASPQLDAAYERANAELERAQRDADAAERLFAQAAIPRSELEVAQQALRAARTAHEEASRTRGFTRIESPIEGTVASRSLRYGEMAAGQPAFVVADLAQLRVVLPLPERDLSRVRAGQPAQVSSSYDASVTSEGSVERVAPVVDAASGTFRATVRLAPDTPLRPGQFVRVRLEIDRREGVLTVPRRAIVWDEGSPFVFVLADMSAEDLDKEKEASKGDGKRSEGGGFSWGGGKEEEKEEAPLPGPARKVVRTPVKLGFEDGEVAELVNGLDEGAQVVVVGNEALRDGARVRLPGDPTTNAATPTDAAAAAPE